MGIKKKSNGTYEVSYSKRHPVTRIPVPRKRVGIKSLAEARRVHAELVVIVNDLLKRQMIPNWESFLSQYVKFIDCESELMKSTVYKRDKVLRKHTLASWKELCIDEITTQDIRNLINSRMENNSESHKKFLLKGIRNVFQHAVDQGLISRNPAPTMKFKVADKINSVLTESQIKILLMKAQQLDWIWYPHYAVALFTGLRNGELFALTWEKVNFEKRQILVNCSWSNKDGLKSTKSGDDRVVEIPNPILSLLMDLKMKSGGNGFVLPRLARWEKGEQARELRLFLKSIGLPIIRFHDLRASWATLLLGKGVAPSKVMAMGGWKDMDTMMIYMRKAGIDIKGATSCLDSMQIHEETEAKVLNFSEKVT